MRLRRTEQCDTKGGRNIVKSLPRAVCSYKQIQLW